MKAAVAALMVASAQAVSRDLAYTHQNGSTLGTPRVADPNCTAGTVAALLTTPAGCVTSKLLGPLQLAGFDISASGNSGLQAAMDYGTDYIYNLTALADGVAGVAAAVTSLKGDYGVSVNRTAAGIAAYNGMNSTLRAHFNLAYAKAACAAIKPIFESGAACVKANCRNTVLNICDGDDATDGHNSDVGGYIKKLSAIAKLWCTRDSTSWNPATSVWPTCESFFPSAAFGTYTVPVSNSSNTTTAPGSAASSIEVGMLAAASVVVSALAF
jgi:hypothetical protein